MSSEGSRSPPSDVLHSSRSLHALVSRSRNDLEVELCDFRRTLCEVAKAKPRRARTKIDQSGPLQPLASIWKSPEVQLLKLLEFSPVRLVDNALKLNCALIAL